MVNKHKIKKGTDCKVLLFHNIKALSSKIKPELSKSFIDKTRKRVVVLSYLRELLCYGILLLLIFRTNKVLFVEVYINEKGDD